MPLRLIATSSDASVRVLSSVGGAVITSCLLPLPPSPAIVSAAYLPTEGKETLADLHVLHVDQEIFATKRFLPVA